MLGSAASVGTKGGGLSGRPEAIGGQPGELDTLLRALDREPPGTFGRQGEDVARLALWRSPATRDGLLSVQGWADWVHEWNIEHPDRPETVADRGVDLVATYSGGRLTAVQVKLRDGGGQPISLGWEELATFAAKSATEPFTDRLLVLLGDATLSSNARQELARQPALLVWAAAEIELHARAGWPADHSGVLVALGTAPTRAVEVRALREYQLAAARDVLAKFADGVDRTQLLMACGTGKTITSHGVAAQLPARHLLVLAPSLSLLRQLITEYRWQYGGRMDGIAVCSDATVGTATRGQDADDAILTDAELGVPTVPEPSDIAAFLVAPPEGRPRVVFATYQSSPRVADAQVDPGVPAFDLVVADEAHYLAGRPSQAFATVLHPTRIRATRRLFGTATPRLVAPHLRATDPEVWASMDDPARFGPVAHRLPFGEAIDAELLSDYRLLVLGADEQAADAIDTRVLVDAGIITDARTLASALAVLRLARDHGRRRIITFHSRKARARMFARLLETHRKWAPAELHLDLVAEAITGDQPTDQRAAALARLARASQPGQPAVRVVTNARCLTAGVDVPALDAVVFVDPRRSRVDVVQAVGRVLRRAEGKDRGYVVVPVPVPDADSVQEAVVGSEFAEVWEVLAALADHDDDLADQIEQARRALGRTGRTGVEGAGRLIVDVPGTDVAGLVAGIWLQAVTRLGSYWSQGLGALEDFVATRGHPRVPQTYVTTQGFRLGTWVSGQREARRQDRLSAERIATLDALGFVWNPRDEDFARGLEALKTFVATHGHARMAQDHVTAAGFRLGGWVSSQRQRRASNQLSVQRVAALDALGFVWDPHGSRYARGLEALRAFIAEHHHAEVPGDHVTDDGFHLGTWVNARRQDRKKGRLASQRVAELQKLGFVWDVLIENFTRGLTGLEEFKVACGHTRVPGEHLASDGFPLGVWVSHLRQMRRQGRIAAERIAALDRLDFAWHAHADRFAQGLAALEQFRDRTGHARVAKSFVTEDGFRLGDWVNARRHENRSGHLSEDRRAQLDDLGFVWEPTAGDFARGLEALRAFVAATGHARVPNRYTTDDGFRLRTWVDERRQDKREGGLAAAQEADLDALGVIWEPRVDNFARGLAALRHFQGEHQHLQVPSGYVTADGFRLGGWTTARRQDHRDDRLALERVQALDELGFTWEPRDDEFERGVSALREFVEANGHAEVVRSTVAGDGFPLGRWADARRQDRRSGGLADVRVAAMDALGFRWAPHADEFSRGLEALKKFVATNHHSNVPQAHVTDDGFALGRWLTKRRQARKAGRLNEEQIAALDVLGVSWDPLAEGFDQGLIAMKNFIRTHGHSLVPFEYVTNDGFRLGGWVNNRRTERRLGRLSEGRVAALEALGFTWSAR